MKITTLRRRPAKRFSRVSGDFPGSPIDLRYVFTLTGGKIERLEIS